MADFLDCVEQAAARLIVRLSMRRARFIAPGNARKDLAGGGDSHAQRGIAWYAPQAGFQEELESGLLQDVDAACAFEPRERFVDARLRALADPELRAFGLERGALLYELTAMRVHPPGEARDRQGEQQDPRGGGEQRDFEPGRHDSLLGDPIVRGPRAMATLFTKARK
jgi:hypothetical protein